MIISTLIFEMRMEAAGSCIYENHRQDMGQEQNIRKKKLMRRLHLEKTRADALFRLWISADTGLLCLESQPETEGLPVV